MSRLTKLAAALILSGIAGGCAPTWQPAEPASLSHVMYVEKPCALPSVTLPQIHNRRCEPRQDAAGWSCYDADNASKLRQRMQVMQSWIEHARARCVVEVDDSSSKHALFRAPYSKESPLISKVTWCGTMYCGPVVTTGR